MPEFRVYYFDLVSMKEDYINNVPGTDAISVCDIAQNFFDFIGFPAEVRIAYDMNRVLTK